MGRISYINASPVYYGLDKGPVPEWLTLVTDVPAALNRQIMAGDLDISPISAAYYGMNTDDLVLIPDFSISCREQVLSVICASNYELGDLSGKKVWVSSESATGASLLKMLLAMKKAAPKFRVGQTHDMNRVPKDVDAVMVIGDAALTQPWEERFAHRIDLGRSWFEMTGLPFVFAVWAVRRSFARQYPQGVKRAVSLLQESRKRGEKNMDEIILKGKERLGLSYDTISRYYHALRCDLDSRSVKGMQLFFDMLLKYKILNRPAKIEFFHESLNITS